MAELLCKANANKLIRLKQQRYSQSFLSIFFTFNQQNMERRAEPSIVYSFTVMVILCSELEMVDMIHTLYIYTDYTYSVYSGLITLIHGNSSNIEIIFHVTKLSFICTQTEDTYIANVFSCRLWPFAFLTEFFVPYCFFRFLSSTIISSRHRAQFINEIDTFTH